MRRILAAVAVAGLVAIPLGGCSDPPDHGYVYSINYDPPSSYYVPGYDYNDCYGTSSNRHCYQEWEPGHTVYVPPEWQIELCKQQGPPAKKNSCGWRDVDPRTYDTVRLGQWWTAVAGATPPPSTP